MTGSLRVARPASPPSSPPRLLRDTAPLPRVPELDGLRALLAWWVVLYHARGATFTAARTFEGGPLWFLADGTLAVDVFMILSGFVIFFLLDRAHEPYRVFVVRRFLRLYPAYAVCFAAMLLLQGAYVANLELLRPYHAPDAFAAMLRDAIDPVVHWRAQVFVHALLLHGPIPEAWLHNAAGAFLNPAWSLSLEWQFYLVVPLAYALIRRRGAAGVAACLAVTALCWATRNLWPPISFRAFLPIHLHLFALGAASYYLFKWVALGDGARRAWIRFAPALAIAGALAIAASNRVRFGPDAELVGRWLPMELWAFVLGGVLAAQSPTAGPLARATRSLLRWRPLRVLGEISYGTYVVHWPLMVVCTAALRRLVPDMTPQLHAALLLATATPLVFAASWALHRFVELPGIALGHRIARRWMRG